MTLTLHADGSFIYVGDANYTGSDTFIYKANEKRKTSNGLF